MKTITSKKQNMISIFSAITLIFIASHAAAVPIFTKDTSNAVGTFTTAAAPSNSNPSTQTDVFFFGAGNTTCNGATVGSSNQFNASTWATNTTYTVNGTAIKNICDATGGCNPALIRSVLLIPTAVQAFTTGAWSKDSAAPGLCLEITSCDATSCTGPDTGVAVTLSGN